MSVSEHKSLSSMPHVLIVDDDDRIRDLAGRYLQEHGFIVCGARDAAAARESMKRMLFDAMILDVMMPGETGLEFTKNLRGEGENIPILLLTALGETQDRIDGLETGADDYLPKPFEPRELVLRLQSILRRGRAIVSAAGPDGGGRFRIGPWLYDPEQSELIDGGRAVRLTAVEVTLLEALASRGGNAVTREHLAQMCGMDAGERTIDVQVTRLRRKIEEDTRRPRYLQTVRGKGYLLRVEKA